MQVQIFLTALLLCGCPKAQKPSAAAPRSKKVAPVAPPAQSAVAADGPHASAPLGINLQFVTYNSTQWGFTNALRSGDRWVSRTFETWDDGRPLKTNAQGWITELLPGQIAAALCPTQAGGKMIVSWEGKGEVRTQSVTRVLEQGQNQITFEAPANKSMQVMIIKTDPKDPVRNIWIGDPALVRKQKFHPLFLKRLAPFGVLRFMEWTHTNNQKLTSWSQRVGPDYVFQGTELGVAFEHQIDLANEVGAHYWVNVPHLADDAYVEELAKLVAARLDPKLKVYVEWSNEVWNQQFEQARWAVEQGLARKLDDEGHIAALKFQARKSIRVFQIFEEAFGGTDRIIRVLGSQSGNHWAHDVLLSFEGAAKVTDALAIAPYFDVYREIDWMEQATDEELIERTAEVVEGKQVEVRQSMASAKKYGVTLIAYEGGAGLSAPAGHEKLNARLDVIDRRPRIKALIKKHLSNWKEAGGGLFVYYSFVQPKSVWGRFAVLETLDQPIEDALKYQAVLEFSEETPRWW